MTVKRYGSAVFDSGLIEMACGDYVTYSDYQKLVAENAALRRIALSYHILTVPEREAPTEPEIDAAIAEIKAQGVDELSKLCFISYNHQHPATEEFLGFCKQFAANLRDRREG